ncbi:nodulin-20a-like [Populus nigra]|uniref:nodulin-20a-like n=1 Tax=Populus nigra TaxID=3691 RepID=UPI002B27916E|nr:nodulin-20a-like [Populus nigra]
MSERFTRRSQSSAGNRNWPIHGGVTTHTSGSVLFAAHAKQMAASLEREPSPMELFVETHVRSQDHQKGAQQFVDNRASHFMETYNNRLRERYGDDILTHPKFDPDLWMEVGSSSGLDKNRVYLLSNTTADNLRSTRSVSTVGSSQSISSSQSKEFVALQQHTAQFTEKYDNLSAEYAQLKASHAQQRAEFEQIKASQAQQKVEYEQQKAAYEQQKVAYEQLREMIMNMANSGTCAPNLFWPYNHQPPPGSPPPPPAPPLY